MSSNGGGLEVCGASANCPMANLYTVISLESAVDLTFGIWVLTVATKGAGVVDVGVEGVGWVSTLTLYLPFGYHGSSFLVRNICFGSWGFPDPVVGAWLSWSWLVLLQLGWLQLGLGLGPSLPSNSKYVLIFQIR